ncbi:autotransporter-associated beta strand repeat-containing protein [Aeoliella mucimassa]|uniref:Probable pectate lyase C n=1 Tax=Aeoliella mucimassa TaxID=2527972 RepID=A0A518AKH3_9BACT|nr:autotransporter-associated beta strand repeat-containing protein [Aeoliella mucimassa]QDU55237.1 Autotransporter-associated beta strand repeat protein [Aeoliella mucimassa]
MNRKVAVATMLVMLLSTHAVAQVLAFPEAEGFGRYASGARTNLSSASVYHVTNLNDSGAGSFRDAVSQPNRFVVFDVGGIIQISPDNSGIVVEDNVTIAGQTAPGGIVVHGNKVSFSGANNTITRYLGIHKGEAGYREDASGAANGVNMMFDHVSVAWGVDETFSLNWDGKGSGLNNITIQDSIIAQGQDRLGHSAGGLMTLPEGSGFSVIRSLFADNVTRNPKVRGENEFINNVVYGWDNAGYIMGDTNNMESHANAIGNYFIESPVDGSAPFTSGTSHFHIYGEDNWVDADRDGVLDGVPVTSYPGADVVASPHAFPTTTAMPAATALPYVLENAGLSIIREPVGTRLVEEVESYGKLGGIIQRETDLFPGYGSDPAYLIPRAQFIDTDNDGMANHWEESQGLDPNDPNDWKQTTAAGYTQLEAYVNELAGPTQMFTSGDGPWSNIVTRSGAGPTLADTVVLAGEVTHATGHGFARRLNVTGSFDVSGGTLSVFDTLSIGGPTSLANSQVAAGRVLVGTNGQAAELLLHSGAELETGQVSAIATGSTLVFDGGQFTATAAPDIQLPSVLATAGGTIDTAGYSGQVSGVISGSGPLVKQGNGSLTLSGNNTYTGPTRVEQGTLLVAGNGLGATSAITVGSGSTLDVSSATAGLTLDDGQSLDGTGNVVGNVIATAGAIVRPQGTAAASNEHAIAIQAEDLNLGSDWAIYNSSTHGTRAGGSYDGTDLSGGGIILVAGENTSAPAAGGLASTTVDLSHSGTWYLFVKSAEPSISAVSGDPSTQPRGNNSFYMSANPSDLQATTSNYETVQTNATSTAAIDAATWNRVSPSLTSLAGVFDPEDGGIDFSLNAGLQTFAIFGRETGTILDGFVLSDRNLTAEQLDLVLNTGGLETASTLTIQGTYTHQAGAVLAIEIADGSSQTKLQVQGTATLAGDLSISLAEGFAPQADDVFEIVQATTLEGQFGNAPAGMRVATASGIGSFQVNYDYSSDLVTLTDYLAGIPGDFNGDGIVDLGDYSVWRDHLGESDVALSPGSTLDGSGLVDAGDYVTWKANFGTSLATSSTSPATMVPEPGTSVLLFAAGSLSLALRRSEHRP